MTENLNLQKLTEIQRLKKFKLFYYEFKMYYSLNYVKKGGGGQYGSAGRKTNVSGTMVYDSPWGPATLIIKKFYLYFQVKYVS